jgi:hypothetical protein
VCDRSGHERQAEPEFVQLQVDHDFPAIQARLEQLGLMMSEPSLAKFTLGLGRCWEAASPTERTKFLAEVDRLSRLHVGGRSLEATSR